MFRRPLGFNGRIGLAEFWFSNMVIVLSGLVFGAFMITTNASEPSPSGLTQSVLIIYLVVLPWFGIAQIVKRSHDLGKTFASRLSLAFEAGDNSDNEYGPNPQHYKKINWLVLSPAFIGLIIGIMKGNQFDFPIFLGMLGFSVGILAGSLLDIVYAPFDNNDAYKLWRIKSEASFKEKEDYLKNLEARREEKISSESYQKELLNHMQDVMRKAKSRLRDGSITQAEYDEIVTDLERSLPGKQ